MNLKAYYIPVEITGTALVYAEDKQRAIKLLKETGVMVAGNKLRQKTLHFNEDEIEEAD